MTHYRAPNKRTIKRGAKGRFETWSLADFGIEAASGKCWCKKCHHGWFPLVASGICPQCGCQEKITLQECFDLKLIEVTEVKVSAEMFDPRVASRLFSGAEFEAEVQDDRHVFVPAFNTTLSVVGGTFADNFYRVPESQNGVVFCRGNWLYFKKKVTN